jgi:hypothetical protein
MHISNILNPRRPFFTYAGPLFTEVDLMQIAQELDAREKAVMMEGGVDSKDFLKYMAVLLMSQCISFYLV